jgi:YHS domain-containing protein
LDTKEIDGFRNVRQVNDLATRLGREVTLQVSEQGEINFPQGGIMTKDPVCGMTLDEKKSEFHTQFAGRKYSFCSEDCKREFEADPDEYVEAVAA